MRIGDTEFWGHMKFPPLGAPGHTAKPVSEVRSVTEGALNPPQLAPGEKFVHENRRVGVDEKMQRGDFVLRGDFRWPIPEDQLGLPAGTRKAAVYRADVKVTARGKAIERGQKVRVRDFTVEDGAILEVPADWIGCFAGEFRATIYRPLPTEIVNAAHGPAWYADEQGNPITAADFQTADQPERFDPECKPAVRCTCGQKQLREKGHAATCPLLQDWQKPFVTVGGAAMPVAYPAGIPITGSPMACGKKADTIGFKPCRRESWHAGPCAHEVEVLHRGAEEIVDSVGGTYSTDSRTGWERFVAWLFPVPYCELPEMPPDVEGRDNVVTSVDVYLDWKDRLRVFLTGRFAVTTKAVTQFPPGLVVSRSVAHVPAPEWLKGGSR